MRGFFLEKVEVLQTQYMNPFRFPWELIMVTSELDIPPVLIIQSVVIGLPVFWCSTSVGPRAFILNTKLFVATNFQLTLLFQHPQLPPPWECQIVDIWF